MPEYPKPIGTGLLHPYSIFSILLLISWGIVLYRRTPTALMKSFFSLLFLISGAMGLLFCYMWFLSAHQVCHANLNLAWAFPLNMILAFTIWFPKAGIVNRLYSKAMIVLLLLFLITFSFWKQKIPFEVILFCLTLLPGLYRLSGYKIFRKAKAQDQTN